MTITRKSKGILQKLSKNLKSKKSVVKVGILHGKYQDGTNIALVGFWNEYGTSRTPERSFMRSTLHDNNNYKDNTKRLAKSITRGTMSVDKGLNILGAEVSQDIKQNIVNVRSPKNADSTIANKGSSNPLIDTGLMLSSIDYQLER